MSNSISKSRISNSEMFCNPTQSEKYLAKLAEKSFLKLWVYPSPYNGEGKELCDLLVISGNHILIFSDKKITWPEKDDLNLCWTRWYNRAVKESVKQVSGAVRYINQFPNKIYLDQKCTTPISLQFPPKENRKIIGILVANGAKEACREFFKGGSGSMLVKPYLKGDDHTKQNRGFNFFSIGDVNPEGDFIHVFNEVTLDIIMKELDTITDFITYLRKKGDFIRSGNLLSAHGEEDLLAWYITHTNNRGEHAFVRPDGQEQWDNNDIFIIENKYSEMCAHPNYLAKKKADEISYVWDEIIESLTQSMIDGKVLKLYDHSALELSDQEKSVRYMAAETRLNRRVLGESIIMAYKQGKNKIGWCKVIIFEKEGKKQETGYIFLTVDNTGGVDSGIKYEEYRRARVNLLRDYCIVCMKENPFLKRIIGIGTEPINYQMKHNSSSKDICFFEPLEWTEELERDAQVISERGMLKNCRYSRSSCAEYSLSVEN